MHERELKVLWRGGALLAVASIVRLAAGAPLSETPLGSPSVLDSLLTASRVAAAADARRTRALEPGERIDPNAADAVELARLPGIGPALAGRIVADRDAAGAFASLEDLTRVKGVGPATLERLADLLTLDKTIPAPRNRGPTRAFGAAATQRIDLNRADASELERLRGVGPVLARRIVEFRLKNGPFRVQADLLGVRGIGPAKLRDIATTPGLRPPTP